MRRSQNLEKDADIEILTPEVPLATLERGRGYVPAEKHEPEVLPIHAILLDADFSPVERVNFHIEPAVDGRQRLVLEVWTDGSVAPVTAVAEASRILEDHFELLTHFPEATSEEEAAEPAKTRPRTERNENLFRNVEELRPSCSRRRTSARNRSTRSRRSSGRWASRSACAWIPRSSSGCALNTNARVRRSASPGRCPECLQARTVVCALSARPDSSPTIR